MNVLCVAVKCLRHARSTALVYCFFEVLFPSGAPRQSELKKE